MPRLARPTVRRRTLPALLLVGLALLGSAAASGPAPRDGAVVGDGVLAAVAAHGKPKVVIYFETQEADDAAVTRTEATQTPTGEAHRRAVIAAAQDRVIAAGAAGFTLHHPFHGVPALAGEIDAGALQRMRHQPGVKRIDLEQ